MPTSTVTKDSRATAAWFAEHAAELTVARSLEQVLAAYEQAAAVGPKGR